MVERKYTVSEIDNLRKIIFNRLTRPITRFIFSWKATTTETVPYIQTIYPELSVVEDQLRTHMLAGHTASDFKEVDNGATEKELKWFLIKDVPPPEGHEKFFVGAWTGETLWDDRNERLLFVEEPVWRQTISHNENPSGPHETRGWNHRNGALGGNATHWAYINTPPLPDVPYPIVPEDQRI